MDVSNNFADAQIHCPGCGSSVAAPTSRGAGAVDSSGVLAGGRDTTGGTDASVPYGIWRDGQQLVMRREARLPSKCVKTNRPADVWLPLKIVPFAFRWTRLYRIALLADEIDEIRVGVCAEQMLRRRRLLVGALVAAIMGGILMMVGFPQQAVGATLGASTVLGTCLTIIAAFLGVTFGRIVRLTRITSDFVWLAGVHPDFLATLPPFTQTP